MTAFRLDSSDPLFPSLRVGEFTLHHLQPGMEGEALRALKVESSANGMAGVRYQLNDGAVEFSVEKDDAGVQLTSRLYDASSAPHWFYTLANCRVSGAKRFARTGLGFSGPTNVVDLTLQADSYSFESYMISALEAADGSALVFYTTQNRDYLTKTQVYNRVFKEEFRNRAVRDAPIYLECGFSTEHIPVPEGGLELPTVYVRHHTSVYEGMQAAAKHIADVNQARVPESSPTYYCSWYEKRAAFDLSDVDRVIAGAKDKGMNFSTLQIDDGYCQGWGNWLQPNDLWPGGMKAAADKIKAAEMQAGIWVAPFTMEESSALWKAHPDWILKDLDGKPILKMKTGAYAQEGIQDRYALDLSHPEVRDYIREVFTTLHQWGYTCFKTDFMDWGYADSTRVSRHTPGKTSAQWFDTALGMIREAIGDSYWLACISYFPPFVGYCDGMRVSSDVGEKWTGGGGNGNDGIGGGTMNVFQEGYHTQFFNNILWANDPDVLFLRDYNVEYSDDEQLSLALFSGMLGGTITVSDFPDKLRDDRIALWQFLHANNTQLTARAPYWGRPGKAYVLVKDYEDGHAIFILNITSDTINDNMPMADLIPSPSATICEWGVHGSGERQVVESLPISLPPHHSKLFWVGDSEAPAGLSGAKSLSLMTQDA